MVRARTAGRISRDVRASTRFSASPGEQHALAAFSDAEPISPNEAVYRPATGSTACWRGYVCGYEVKGGLLYPCELWVNHPSGDASHAAPAAARSQWR